ncbi:MAG TPA: hypothetical protein VMQ44_00945 [Candidatus Saccharimonadales bacterium]|nr:hypothetical protein [Candidatus Saccharimonadales bacterium]
MKKKILTCLVALSCVLAMAQQAITATTYCDQHAQCPGGSNNQNGRICYVKDKGGGKHEGVIVTENPAQSTDNHCMLHSGQCPNSDRDCNQLEQWTATWYEVNCETDNGLKARIGWCLDSVQKKVALNYDCSGNKCKSTGKEIVPPPIPSQDF